MKEYKVKITEISEKTVTVEADSAGEAEFIAYKNYKRAEDGYVLSADDFVDVGFTTVF